jgi:hypothetical protein
MTFRSSAAVIWLAGSAVPKKPLVVVRFFGVGGSGVRYSSLSALVNGVLVRGVLASAVTVTVGATVVV